MLRLYSIPEDTFRGNDEDELDEELEGDDE